ncbi:MAG: hypothetical protein NWF13_05235 [Candidatus Bathyarchaeota archaeon]|nr:hypothetical protein [Candidatus Bathyarchaeota archaeon]
MKTLVYVPRMFTRDEFQKLVMRIPDDFDSTRDEFWKYVSDRLRVIASKIRWVYTDSDTHKEEASKVGASTIVAGLVTTGVKVQAAVNPIHAAEAEAWREMAGTSPSQVVREMYDESVDEIGRHVVDIVDQTLEDGEMGVLFLNPLLKISFPEKLRVIRLFPFDPQDYLTRHRVMLTQGHST